MRIDNNINNLITNGYQINNRTKKIYDFNTNLSPEILNKEEKQFFANMFPEKKVEVMEYNFYNRNGKVSTNLLGSLIDRRY
jgi:hypothetical protein